MELLILEKVKNQAALTAGITRSEYARYQDE
jgi:hypothetical protein